MRRASVSVASNIAEGRGRLNPAEFRQFLGIAKGSICERKTQLLMANRLGMASGEATVEVEILCEEVSKMLASFIKKLSVMQMRDRRSEGLKLRAESLDTRS